MIIVIAGPTGVGKTKLSIELAKKYKAEIINADSVQVYKKLDIGSAKATTEEKEGIPHHLLDICDIEDFYTVYHYQRDCRRVIDKLLSEGKNVIIVGGTGLYIRAALFDYQFQEEGTNNNYESLSNLELVDRIKTYQGECDIHPNNRKRLVRRLNQLENNTTSTNTGNKPLYDFYMIGLTTDRETLYQKIDSRVDKMIELGLVDEARSLYNKKTNSKVLATAIGYKELFLYFDGEVSFDEALNLIKKNSRHYAKRQYTFFKHQFPMIKWYQTNYDNFDLTTKEIIEDIEKTNF